MNKPIRRVVVAVMMIFALLLGNITFGYAIRSPELNAHPRNARVRDTEFGQHRGSIVVGNIEVAVSEERSGTFRYARTYPNGPLYSAITGFYSYIYSRTGLEASRNAELSGTDDSLFARRVIDFLTNRPQKGASIFTTINPAAQTAALQGMSQYKGAVVALDASTGAVLALVTTPNYNPNQIATLDYNASRAAYEKLNADPNRPLANRAVRERYPPGSTFKLVTAAAGLETGKVTVDTRLPNPVSLPLPSGQRLPSGARCPTETTMSEALRVSCNTLFANLAMRVGTDAMRKQAERFGFGTEHLPDLEGVASRYPDGPLDDSLLAYTGIGQYEVAASPLQMAMVSAAIANNGVVMKPYLVSSVRSADLQELSQAKPEEFGTALNPENARALQAMMVNVVRNGSGRNAQIGDAEVGGKTGTAQRGPGLKPYAWFTSWAKRNGRSVAVAVLIDEAPVATDEISGGRMAAPIARAVMEAALR